MVKAHLWLYSFFSPTGLSTTVMLPRLRMSFSAFRPSFTTSINNLARNFSTSISVCSTQETAKPTAPEIDLDLRPPYPYGKTQWYKQSKRGLYGGLRVRFGNKVSE